LQASVDSDWTRISFQNIRRPCFAPRVQRSSDVIRGSTRWCETDGVDDRPNILSLPHMYRSSRSVTRTVFSSRRFHSSPLCLSATPSDPTSSKPAARSETTDGARPDGEHALSERLRGAASLFRGCIAKATGDTAISIRKRADGFTTVTQALFSELGGQLNRATGYEEIELLKKKVEEQGMLSLPWSLMLVEFIVANLLTRV
jgi:hypothetical protein